MITSTQMTIITWENINIVSITSIFSEYKTVLPLPVIYKRTVISSNCKSITCACTNGISLFIFVNNRKWRYTNESYGLVETGLFGMRDINVLFVIKSLLIFT